MSILIPGAILTLESWHEASDASRAAGPNGRARYMTFRREPDGWVYAGVLPRGVFA